MNALRSFMTSRKKPASVIGVVSLLIGFCATVGLSLSIRSQENVCGSALVMSEQDVTRLQSDVAELEKETQELKRLPNYYFGKAVDNMLSAKAQDNDSADREAISQFQSFIDRFPGDALDEGSSRHIAELEQRISERTRTLQRAQAEVVQLVEVCKENVDAIQRAGGGRKMFTENNKVDWAAYQANETEERPYQRALKGAQD